MATSITHKHLQSALHRFAFLKLDNVMSSKAYDSVKATNVRIWRQIVTQEMHTICNTASTVNIK